MRVLILNLNPSFDHWVLIDKRPDLEHVLRGTTVVHQVDGKGLNIGRVFENFGFTDYLCVNMLGGTVGKLIESKCKELGIKTRNFWIQDESRINTAIVRDYDGTTSVQMVNEAGPTATRSEVEEFKRFFSDLLQDGDVIVISGSAVNGFLPSDLVDIARLSCSKNVSLAVDISNEWLKRIVDHPIAVLKVNDDELRLAFNLDSGNLNALDKFRIEKKITLLIVTLGDQGAIAISDEVVYRVSPPSVDGNYAVGSGDSFFAGFLLKKLAGSTLKDSLLSATACGAANVKNYGAAIFSKDEYHDCLSGVKLFEVTNGLLYRS
jgi:1-phosphofructokinase/tagatose 6-phosphate kinase